MLVTVRGQCREIGPAHLTKHRMGGVPVRPRSVPADAVVGERPTEPADIRSIIIRVIPRAGILELRRQRRGMLVGGVGLTFADVVV